MTFNTSVSKGVSVENLFKGENKFDLHENKAISGTRFHTGMHGFTQRLFLIQRQKAAWKWPIDQ